MPIQRPKEFSKYGTPNTVRGAIRINLVYTDFYNSAGERQSRLLIERPQGDDVDYLELEGADRALRKANPDLVKEVVRIIGRPPGESVEMTDGPMEVPEVQWSSETEASQ